MADRFQWLRTDPLAWRTATTPDRTALIDLTGAERTELTYARLDALVETVSSELDEIVSSAGGHHVGITVSPGLAFVTALFGTHRADCTAAVLDPGLTQAELDQRVERIEPAVLLCETETEDRCLATDHRVVSVDESERVRSVARSLGPDGSDRSRQHLPGSARQPGATDETDRQSRAPDHERPALVLFTSGTTGEPKGVCLTMANVLSSAVGSALRLGVTPQDRWLGCLPVHHMGGLAPIFRSTLYGTTLVMQGRFDSEETASLIHSETITGVSLVPTQLSRLLDAGFEPPASLRTVLLGGAPATESLLERASEAGVPVASTYGLTETASQVTTALPDTVQRQPDTVGQPLFPTTVRIIDDGTPVDPGERGEIVVSGPTVTPGYLDSEATADTFCEWGLQTGDIGVQDTAGRLRILGRADDMINTGGELVAPAEVVSTLCEHPGVSETAVVGLPDEEWGERVSALVVLEDDTQLTAVSEATLTERLREHCREHLSEYKLPKTVRRAQSIPRTHSGTVDRDAVAARIDADRQVE